MLWTHIQVINYNTLFLQYKSIFQRNIDILEAFLSCQIGVLNLLEFKAEMIDRKGCGKRPKSLVLYKWGMSQA